jgi:glycosyltransferase involved in cell wall biosynthesis
LTTVAVDARMIDSSGIGTYLRGLLPRLVASRPRWHFTLLGDRRRLADAGLAEFANTTLVGARAPIYSIRQQYELAMSGRAAQLFWSPHYDAAVLAPGRLVVTVHDLFHLACSGDVGRMRGVARRAYARGMFAAVARRADLIMCDSEFTRAELVRLVGTTRGEVAVVPLGVEEHWSEGSSRAPRERPYILYVGNIKPHKNLRTLVEAFATVMGDIPHDLVIVGQGEGMRTVDDDIRGQARRCGGRVHFVGQVDQGLLVAYVRHAAALVFPSLYEGFGLPPLEAMKAGTPCIVSRSGSLPEVCGDAPLYFDATDAGQLARHVRAVVGDESLASELRERGLQRASGYTWGRAVEMTLELFEDVLSRRRPG